MGIVMIRCPDTRRAISTGIEADRETFYPRFPGWTPKLGQMFAVFRPSGKIEASFGQLPSPRAARTVVEGLIWPFSLAFGRTPPIGSC
jgi:hypothetical protein